MRVLFLYSALCLFLFTQCKKKKEEEIPTPVVSDPDAVTCSENNSYYPLTKGSYWIYENSTFYPDNTRNIHGYDSTYVLNRDTVVDGKTFFLTSTTTTYIGSTTSYVEQSGYRYSGEYVLAFNDYKLFSYCVTDQILETHLDPTGLWRSESKVLNRDTTFTVPAGTFKARIEQNRYLFPAYQNVNHGQFSIQNILYAKNVGLIYDGTPFMSTPEILVEKRLIRYHIE